MSATQFTKEPVFPPLPAYTGQVAPVYYEPIAGSGERYCIAVLAVGDDGRAAAVNSVHGRLPCLGEVGASIAGFGGRIAAHFNQFVADGTSPGEWRPPFQQMMIGEWRRSRGSDVFAMAAANIATLATLGHGGEDETLPDEPLVRPVSKELTNFIRSLKDRVARKRSDLAELFGQHYSLTRTRHAQTTVDYLSQKYAACYAVLNPKARNIRLYANDSLWRLAGLRDASLFRPRTIEAVVWVPDENLPLFSPEEHEIAREHAAELKAEAKREEIDVATVTTPEEAAGRLLAAEDSRG